MGDTITNESAYSVYSTWARIINLKGENGMYITLPCSSTYRIRKFISNSRLHSSFFPESLPLLLSIDGYEREDFSFADFQHQTLQALNSHADSLNTWLTQHSQPIGIFLTGVDTALRKGNLHTLQYLTPLLENHFHFSLIFITELNIPESSLFSQLVATSPLIQNIRYRPVKSIRDAQEFLSWIQSFWDIQIPIPLAEGLLTYLGGHYWLLKEGVRLFRDNPSFSLENILDSPSLVRKGITIFQRLSESDQTTLLSFLRGTRIDSVSEYLSQTHLIYSNTLGIAYFSYIREKLFRLSLSTSDTITHHFTPLEQTVFSLLYKTKMLVSRDTIAQALWEDTAEEKYSDWAIDQIIHRIREKLLLTNSPYRIDTKKKRGFILQSLTA